MLPICNKAQYFQGALCKSDVLPFCCVAFFCLHFFIPKWSHRHNCHVSDGEEVVGPKDGQENSELSTFGLQVLRNKNWKRNLPVLLVQHVFLFISWESHLQTVW